MPTPYATLFWVSLALLSLLLLVGSAYAGEQAAGLAAPAQRWITGYYPAQNKVEAVSEIPWSKYTEINHFAAAAGVNATGHGDGSVALHYLEPGEMRDLVTRGHAAGTRVLVTIKDNDRNRDAFPQNTAPATISTLVSNIVSLVNDYHYDGVDLDWEARVAVNQYVDLIARLRSVWGTNKLITIAVGNWSGLEQVALRAQAQLDHINIMCYDMDNTGSYVWHNNALSQNGDPTKMTCDWRVRAFTRAGVPSSKIGIGIPFYGRRWTGATEPLQTTGTRARGWINYRDLVTDSVRWQPKYRKWDAQYVADYLSIPDLNEFDSFNGERSIRAICQWATREGFGGFMTFDLSYEFLGKETAEARYPLSTALWRAVRQP